MREKIIEILNQIEDEKKLTLFYNFILGVTKKG